MRPNRLLDADLTRKHWNERTAARALRAWRESAMPLSEFARAQGLSPERLRRWEKRMEDGEGTTAPMTFIPAAVMGTARAVVRLPGGVELEGDAVALPAGWVAALARALVNG